MKSIVSRVPPLRVGICNGAEVREDADYVLYWMIASRRSGWNFALDRAAEWSRTLGKPLLVLEAVRCGHAWASERFHRFVLQGMAANARRLARTRAAYYPYVEARPGEGRGLLQTLSRRAAVVVTDDFPCFFLPRMVAAAGERLEVRLERIDSNGLLPLAAADRAFVRAVDFRRFLQKTLPPHLEAPPLKNALARATIPVLERLPAAAVRRWPAADVGALAADPGALAGLAVDHSVPPVSYGGGSAAGAEALRRFVDRRLPRYTEGRRDVVQRATSELSPYLHFGHLSAHEVFAAVAAHEGWNPGALFHKATASRLGWWGMSEAAESFLDELVTWRELSFNMCSQRDDYERYESLPDWARQTLEAHANDPREHVYTLEEFEGAATHDELWNAAQRELVRDGRIHNYLRMLWGKKILEWSATPRDALAVMIELNNKYAVDGRDPNSYSGIFWCLGRYDRAWGPERPVFGKVRYMSSESTRRKLDAKAYMAEFGAKP